eukprot:scaffold32908_cov47-Prasinocladus_malaysianus.AAC.1
MVLLGEPGGVCGGRSLGCAWLNTEHHQPAHWRIRWYKWEPTPNTDLNSSGDSAHLGCCRPWGGDPS